MGALCWMGARTAGYAWGALYNNVARLIWIQLQSSDSFYNPCSRPRSTIILRYLYEGSNPSLFLGMQIPYGHSGFVTFLSFLFCVIWPPQSPGLRMRTILSNLKRSLPPEQDGTHFSSYYSTTRIYVCHRCSHNNSYVGSVANTQHFFQPSWITYACVLCWHHGRVGEWRQRL